MSRRYPDIENLITKEWAEKYLRSVAYPDTYKAEPGVDLPLSFYDCLREGDFHIIRDLGVDLKQLLHVSQSNSFLAPLRIGDKIISKAAIQKINSRKIGGPVRVRQMVMG